MGGGVNRARKVRNIQDHHHHHHHPLQDDVFIEASSNRPASKRLSKHQQIDKQTQVTGMFSFNKPLLWRNRPVAVGCHMRRCTAHFRGTYQPKTGQNHKSLQSSSLSLPENRNITRAGLRGTMNGSHLTHFWQ